MNPPEWLGIVQGGAPMWQNCLVLFYALLIGHALADFPLQGSFLAMAKDSSTDLEQATGRAWPRGTWVYCLTMHSLIHGGTVWLLTGSLLFSLIEFVLHWLIDFAKSNQMTSFYADQALHILCKAIYVVPLCSAGT
ncbi:MAG: DUF3307 domain-containing protein [Verrucomicrobiota bacterium]